MPSSILQRIQARQKQVHELRNIRWWLNTETRERPRRYFQGPGFLLGIKFPNRGIHGRDAVGLAKRVKKQICKDYCDSKEKCKDMTINLTGWSRGAVVCMGVARMLDEDGCRCKGLLGLGSKHYRPVDVNWIGLFDAVEMVAAPGRLLPGDQGFPGTVPTNVKSFAHAIKTDKQLIFPTTRYGRNEKEFRKADGGLTNHSDIGESKKRGNNEAYEWIKNHAISSGVSF